MHITNFRHRLALIVGSIVLPTSMLAGTATWDDLPNGQYLPTPLGYQGYNWYFGDSTFGNIGPGDGNHGQLQYTTMSLEGDIPYSPPNGAYNAWGNTPMRVESLTTSAGDEFKFSGWFSGQPDLGGAAAAVVEVQGFIGASSTPAFTTSFALPAGGAWINEDFSSFGAVNKLLFSPLDANGGPSQFLGGYFWLDDAQVSQVSSVPDPGTWSVTAMAACVMLGMMRRSRLG